MSGLVLVLQVVKDVGPHSVPVLVISRGFLHGVQQANVAAKEVNLHADPVARSNVDGNEQQPQLKDVPRGGIAAPASHSVVVVLVH